MSSHARKCFRVALDWLCQCGRVECVAMPGAGRNPAVITGRAGPCGMAVVAISPVTFAAPWGRTGDPWGRAAALKPTVIAKRLTYGRLRGRVDRRTGGQAGGQAGGQPATTAGQTSGCFIRIAEFRNSVLPPRLITDKPALGGADDDAAKTGTKPTKRLGIAERVLLRERFNRRKLTCPPVCDSTPIVAMSTYDQYHRQQQTHRNNHFPPFSTTATRREVAPSSERKRISAATLTGYATQFNMDLRRRETVVFPRLKPVSIGVHDAIEANFVDTGRSARARSVLVAPPGGALNSSTERVDGGYQNAEPAATFVASHRPMRSRTVVDAVAVCTLREAGVTGGAGGLEAVVQGAAVGFRSGGCHRVLHRPALPRRPHGGTGQSAPFTAGTGQPAPFTAAPANTPYDSPPDSRDTDRDYV